MQRARLPTCEFDALIGSLTDDGAVQPAASRPVGPTDVPGAAPRRHAVVLGMHRSGTSLTARLLGDLGWYLGRPDELLEPREDNPGGYFERADVQVFNDRVLSQIGASWDRPPGAEELQDFGDESVDKELEALVTALEADAGGAAFALKDPRLCVLWPLWERHLPRSATLVLTFRHPAEVAASLYERDGLPVPMGLALWEDYVRRSIVAAQHRAAVVVRYGDLLAQPEKSIEGLAAALGTTVPSGWVQAVRPAPYHSRGSSHEGLLTASQRDLWSWIERAPTSVDRIDPDDVPGRTEKSSTELLRHRRDAVRLEAEVGLLRRSLADARSELVQLNDERESMDQLVESLRQRRLEQSQRVEAMRQESAEAQDHLGRELATLGHIRDELADALAEKIALVRVARAREQVFLYERHHLLRAVSVVEGQRRAHEAALVSMRSSRAWRWGRGLTAPLRWMSAHGEET